MKKNNSSVFWWIFAIVFTLSIAYYQRTTGPTYPVKNKIQINDDEVRFKLPRSNDSHIPALITINGVSNNIRGQIEYKKFKTNEDWKIVELKSEGDKLSGELPNQPPAGKLIYKITLFSDGEAYKLTDEPVVIRFKGAVPPYILWPHIIFMFMAMLFSSRTGIEAIRKGDKTFNYTFITIILLLFGGMILGPVVQKYAFGEFWTGWPFGKDLTDNKTLVAFVFWIVAWFRLRKNKNNRGWVIAASIILLMIYMIPHSMFGSELDYSSGQVVTGK